MRSGRAVSRGLLLESIGAAIMPDLTDGQVQALQHAGVRVLDNRIVAELEPSKHPTKRRADPWHLDAIGARTAREKGLTGKGALIGVLDTGIDPSHPEFEGKQIYFRAFDSDGNAIPYVEAKDYQHHGSHVSALCAGRNVGVAPGADLAVAAVLTTTVNGRTVGRRSQVLAGLAWLTRGEDGLPRPADVVNASLGEEAAANTSTLYEFHLAARVRGSLVVAAIGNEGHKGEGYHQTPGMYDISVSVGATDRQHQVAEFSAWGPCYAEPASPAFKPDLVAPGMAVESAVPGAKYSAMDGTSVACPMVTGAAALLLEHDPGLRDDVEALGTRILSLTKELPDVGTIDPRRSGRGRLDLSAI